MFSFILKVIVLSAIISAGIKWLGPQLAIPATPNVAIAMVCLPTIIMALALGLQYRLQHR